MEKIPICSPDFPAWRNEHFARQQQALLVLTKNSLHWSKRKENLNRVLAAWKTIAARETDSQLR